MIDIKNIKKIFLSFTLISTSLIFSQNIYSSSLENYPMPVYNEDIEILKLEDEIKSLNEKLDILKKEKNKKVKELRENKREKKVALVLSGGGAKGFAHIGVLRELEKNNIKIDCIVGNSIGAVIGALYSVGYTPDEIENIMKELNLRDSLKDNPNRTDTPLERRLANDEYAFSIKYDSNFNFYLPKSIRNSQRGYLFLKNLFARAENIKDFDKLPIPLRIIATNLDTGKATVFKSGDLAKVVTASTAIPSIFDPVNIDGTYYIDGMISRNFPVEDAIAMGANIIIGVNVGADLKNTPGNYNIFTTAEQLLAIQSASTTDFQKKLASILIEPDLTKYKSSDYDSVESIIKEGESATILKISELNSLPKYNTKSNKEILKNKNQNTTQQKEKHLKDIENNLEDIYYFNNIKISGIEDKKKITVIENILKSYENKNTTVKEMNTLSLKLYGLDFVNKIYYKNIDNTLYLTLEEAPSNTVGVGFNYQSDYYTSVKIATDLNTFGKFGNFTNIYLEGGDYLGAGINSLFYYGVENKFGFNTSLYYDESPLFLYSNNSKLAKLKNKSVNLELSILTQYLNEILVSYGASVKYGSIENDIGNINEEFLRSFDTDNYGQGFVKFVWDKADSNYFTKKGFKSNLDYFWGGSVDKESSDFYGVTFSYDHFYPINRNLTFNTRFFGGSMNGTSIPYDGFIKLGGTTNNSRRKEFAFYGYNPQQRFLKNLFAAKVGLQYEFMPNFFVSGGVNVATFNKLNFEEDEDLYKDEMWEEYYKGAGISIGYLSPIGPVEFSISKNDDFSDTLYQFSIGYTLE